MGQRVVSDALKALLAADDLPKVPVKIPEWGIEEAFIRTMTGTDRDAYEESNLEKNAEGKMKFTMANISARLVARCLVDAAGARIVPDDKIGALGQKSGKVISRLFRIAQQVNGLDHQSVESAAKN